MSSFNRMSGNHKQGGALQQLSSLLGQTMRLENVADLKGKSCYIQFKFYF